MKIDHEDEKGLIQFTGGVSWFLLIPAMLRSALDYWGFNERGQSFSLAFAPSGWF
jgi:hypothetical protein